jgi:hypothetical protein
MLRLLRHASFHFVPRQVLRQRFAPRSIRVATSDMRLDRQPRLLDRLGESLDRVGRISRTAQIEPELIRVVEVALAAVAKRPLDELGVRRSGRPAS